MSITLATVLKGIQVFTALKPIKRIRQFRAVRNLEKVITGEEPVNTQLQSLIRTVLKVLGGGLVTSGAFSGSELEAGVGAVSVLLGLAWSWYDKKRKADD